MQLADLNRNALFNAEFVVSHSGNTLLKSQVLHSVSAAALHKTGSQQSPVTAKQAQLAAPPKSQPVFPKRIEASSPGDTAPNTGNKTGRKPAAKTAENATYTPFPAEAGTAHARQSK
jgi:hypothetical protein